MKKLIECVPNFSEGKDEKVIRAIADSIRSVEGIKLLNIDPGKATNRTVITFVGAPEDVVEAAFRSIKTAGELIDMRKHKGEHPRMGATDVCPLVPLYGISMKETVEYALKLAKRVGEELGIPVYLYEEAQPKKERKNLSVIRAGEYEGFFKKIQLPEWKPDFGPAIMDEKRGATVIGARDFLIAYNVNLNTTSVRRANSVAFDVREAGRVMREGDPITGKIVYNPDGTPKVIPGSLKHVKAIGWYIEEYGIAQVSMNLTNIRETPLHVAFDEVCKKASERGLRVTGSELVGLIPLQCLLDAGKYFLKKQKRSAGVSEKELIKIAVKSLGLDDLKPFNPEERIIEYLIKDKIDKELTQISIADFADQTASESPAPGGGSVAALLGSLAASLGTMVANLSSHKRGWDHRWEFFSDWAEKGQKQKEILLNLINEDTLAFKKVMEALALPRSNEEEMALRKRAITDANKRAMEVPFLVMQESLKCMGLLEAMAKEGNPASASDAGVGALCARSAVWGAWMNVCINAAGVEDEEWKRSILNKGKEILNLAIQKEKEIIACVEQKMNL
ncbi:MAG: glutamate formimidoyltransferase [Bacteroidia bacterium]|nr:glutamate formimidoyltransferase [Bacteroidia bacterium]